MLPVCTEMPLPLPRKSAKPQSLAFDERYARKITRSLASTTSAADLTADADLTRATLRRFADSADSIVEDMKAIRTTALRESLLFQRGFRTRLART